MSKFEVTMHRITDLYYKIKWWLQKKFRGYSDIEIWNLDETIIDFVLPRLKVFKTQTQAFPPALKNFEDWEKILDEIIWAMEYVSSVETPYLDLKEKYGEELTEDGKLKYIVEFEKLEERARKGFEYFGNFINYFWW